MNKVARMALQGASGALKATQFALEVYADLTPLIRMRGPRRLSKNMGAGVLGAEVATWWAISPSLLPRKWWITAANVAIVQGFGHAVGTGISFVSRRIRRKFKFTTPLDNEPRVSTAVHVGLAATTAVVTLRTPARHEKQVQLAAERESFSLNGSIVGMAVGTVGYGVLLALGEAVQNWVDTTNRQLARWLPPVASWPIALVGVVATLYFATDKVVLRRALSQLYARAEKLNQEVMPGATPPTESTRSGSPESIENWENLGRQGRSVIAAGPRIDDIRSVMEEPAHEPIRIYIGLTEGRTPEDQAKLVLEEMERTNAFEREAIAIMSSAGTGWLNDFVTSPFEFLLRGNSAIVAMQYSFLPSAVSYIADRTTPVTSSRVLISAIRARLDQIPEERRPKLYVAGESLGAYGVADSFDSLDELLETVDGALFTGAPGFTRLHTQLTNDRDRGSIQRLPVLDGGRHVRFVATENHLEHDFRGDDFDNDWEFPRVVFAQHASDPVVWWDWKLFFLQPDWLREPGSRGVSAPAAQDLDVYDGLRWVPFITGWQVGLDQVNSLDFLPGHGHVYRYSVIKYWAAVLDKDITDEQAIRVAQWVRKNMERVRNEEVPIPTAIRQTIQSGPGSLGNLRPPRR
ncbi:alpha/beta-hydrolase family protein [Corynebacterium lubricantis]|uniref:alpha/beta-hydrolase family protein n=1 Tax=Corynebacterium lubricantis TaxID=541095 RepID=UPI00036E0227|nr:alpha/beta-hydrolase family protein [Corynebacterium lubricantis]